MAKEYKVGDRYYLPVEITDTDYDKEFPVQFDYFDGRDHCNESVKDGVLLTAEEVADDIDLIARSTLERYSEKAQEKIKELEAENRKLKQQLADANELLTDAQAQVKELTEADCMRLQEFKPIIKERDRLKAEVATRTDNVKNLVEENDRLKKLLNSKEEGMRKIEEYADQLKKIADDLGDENEKLKAENDKLKTDSDEWGKSARMYSERLCGLKEEVDAVKAELEQEKKRTQVWKDSSEEHRKRAEELEGDVKRYEEDIADNEVKVQRLGQENDSLKADILELKAQINVFRSSRPDPKEVEELKKRIDVLEKLRSSHIRTIHALATQIKEKNFMISALVKKGIELEEGGESNG